MELVFRDEMTRNAQKLKQLLQLFSYLCKVQVWYAAIYKQEDWPLALASAYCSS